VKLRTSELKERALDWAVHVAMHGKCEGYPEHHYSADWAHGGPIIEREGIDVRYTGQTWGAARQLNEYEEPDEWFGPTPLIAAMRCYVASVLGDEVDVPEELK
jgi:hypothetical protein